MSSNVSHPASDGVVPRAQTVADETRVFDLLRQSHPERLASLQIPPVIYTPEMGGRGGAAHFDLNRFVTSNYGPPLIWTTETIYTPDLITPPSHLTDHSHRIEGSILLRGPSMFSVELRDLTNVTVVVLVAGNGIVWSHALTYQEIESGKVVTPWDERNPLLLSIVSMTTLTLRLQSSKYPNPRDATRSTGVIHWRTAQGDDHSSAGDKISHGYDGLSVGTFMYLDQEWVYDIVDNSNQFYYHLGFCIPIHEREQALWIARCYTQGKDVDGALAALEIDLSSVKRFMRVMDRAMARRLAGGPSPCDGTRSCLGGAYGNGQVAVNAKTAFDIIGVEQAARFKVQTGLATVTLNSSLVESRTCQITPSQTNPLGEATLFCDMRTSPRGARFGMIPRDDLKQLQTERDYLMPERPQEIPRIILASPPVFSDSLLRDKAPSLELIELLFEDKRCLKGDLYDMVLTNIKNTKEVYLLSEGRRVWTHVLTADEMTTGRVVMPWTRASPLLLSLATSSTMVLKLVPIELPQPVHRIRASAKLTYGTPTSEVIDRPPFSDMTIVDCTGRFEFQDGMCRPSFSLPMLTIKRGLRSEPSKIVEDLERDLGVVQQVLAFLERVRAQEGRMRQQAWNRSHIIPLVE